nr:leucine-rich repeat domain-containing protein [Lachnospiraceae bacterium]
RVSVKDDITIDKVKRVSGPYKVYRIGIKSSSNEYFLEATAKATWTNIYGDMAVNYWPETTTLRIEQGEGEPAAYQEFDKGEELTTSNGYTYKVTKFSGSTGEVSLTSVGATAKKVTVPATIKVDGYTFKVTSIAANALKKKTSLTTLVIGTNVSSIGANAFFGDKKLKTITVNSTKIKSIGAKAFKGVPKTAKAKLPKAKKKAYKKLMKKAKYVGKYK